MVRGGELSGSWGDFARPVSERGGREVAGQRKLPRSATISNTIQDIERFGPPLSMARWPRSDGAGSRIEPEDSTFLLVDSGSAGRLCWPGSMARAGKSYMVSLAVGVFTILGVTVGHHR